MTRKLRLEMAIKLYKNGKVVESTRRLIPSRLSAFVQERKNSEWDSGTLTVTYNRELDYWNAGKFTDLEQFNRLLSEFTDRELVKEFA